MSTDLENAKKAVGDLDKEFVKNQPKISDVLKGLESAIAKKDGTMIDLYFERVEPTSALSTWAAWANHVCQRYTPNIYWVVTSTPATLCH